MPLDKSATAKSLIRKLAAKSEDEVFFLAYEDGGSENPATGEWTSGTVVKTPIDGARVAYKSSLIDGISIRSGDFQLLAPFDIPIPSQEYWFEDENSKYTVIAKPEVNHAGKTQLYKFQLRRS